MKIKCSHCNKEFNLPDDRLPTGKEIVFPCPDCKGSIKLDLRKKSAQGDTSVQGGKKQLKGDALKEKILKSVKDLPPMPQTIHKVREVMSKKDSSFKELANVLETDQALATKVLKMSNSSYYGMGGKVSSIQHASVVLGHKTLGELITVAGTSALLGNMLKGYKLDAGDMWRHSMGVAFGSKLIASKKKPALAEDAFAAGLIHDSGKLILDEHVFEREEQFKEFMSDGEHNFLDAEKEILGLDHSEIASEVCKSWQVPESLTGAIRYHHNPSDSGGDQLAYIVHMADAMAMMTGLGTGVDNMSYQMDDKAMENLGIDAEEFSDVLGEMVEYVDKAAQGM